MSLHEMHCKFLGSGLLLWSNLSADDKVSLLCYVSHVLKQHAENPASYRTLLYRQFGLMPSAYVPLQICGLLDVHNYLVAGFQAGNNTGQSPSTTPENTPPENP